MMKSRNIRKVIRTLIVELIIYASVVVAYFFFVLRYLKDWLGEMYQNNLVVYAFICLGLIVVQGMALEIVTSFLLNYIEYEPIEG